MNNPAHTDRHCFKRIPGATYRLQFNRQFTFRHAAEILDYLAELGVTDIYASPWFQAGPNSTHGYDVCCFGEISSALGSAEDFERFNSRRHELGLGLLLDMVPNHMGADLSNDWWLDVLEHGPKSKFAGFFDIDWQPVTPSLRNKVLLPVLGDHYGKVLERGEIRLGFGDGRFFLGYLGRKFPVTPGSLPASIDQSSMAVEQILAEFNGIPGQPETFDRLHGLVQRQHYRLACWRVGSEEINYRRFFDVTELVALRMECPEVFAASHELLFEWLEPGIVTGLRIDHPDGLRDPAQYLGRLQSKAAECLKPSGPLYIVVEKILSGDESLPDDWPVDGTTGYDFLNRVNDLFVDGLHESDFDQTYRRFLGALYSGSDDDGFKGLVSRSKREILETTLVSELDSLTRRLHGIAMNCRMDFTFSQLRSALAELIAAFPVYRTNSTERSLQASVADRAVIQKAIADVMRTKQEAQPALFEFLHRLLTLELLSEFDADAFSQAREFVMRFQQLTGPVMAKGLEDTAFYNFNRLISLNEVGGDPERFGVSLEAFHNANAAIAAHWPHTLLATATHDTKRGEDARARINVLSEIPGEWRAAVTRWRDWNAGRKTTVKDAPAPDANDEYLLYQSLVGAFPVAADDAELPGEFRERVSVFMLKAVREAKRNTSWLRPNAEYETAVREFVWRVLDDSSDDRFVLDLKALTRCVAFFGRFNSLAQTLLKITSPGVPDFYQGTELWDFSFVDPDNRRPVDFSMRRILLNELKAKFRRSRGTSVCSELLNDAAGEAKLFVIWRALELRNRLRGVFDDGAYVPLPAFGSRKDHICAFARTLGTGSVLTVVPRLVCGLVKGGEVPPLGETVWEDTFLPLPNARNGDLFQDVFTGETVQVKSANEIPRLSIAEILKLFPVALLEAIECS